MADGRGIELLSPTSKNVNQPESCILLASFIAAAFVGILTIVYAAFQWRQNISLIWMKAIARAKKNPKFMNKVLYAREGAKSRIDRTLQDFPWQVCVVVDGVEIEVPESQLNPRSS